MSEAAEFVHRYFDLARGQMATPTQSVPEV
jgi:hypothetical protein